MRQVIYISFVLIKRDQPPFPLSEREKMPSGNIQINIFFQQEPL